MQLDEPDTPCLLLDPAILQRNIDRMARRCAELGVGLRPHFKTPKCLPVAELLVAAGGSGFCVSTIHEAEYLAGAGFDDIFIAVPIEGRKLKRIAKMIRAGKRLSVLAETPAAVAQLAHAGAEEKICLPIWIEVDVDHYRTGIDATGPEFLDLVRTVKDAPGLCLAGLMSYGGASYGCEPAESEALAERHRLALLAGADRVTKAGFPRPRLSFGSTPAVLHARTLVGIDEVRCGIYIFQDLFQAGIGAAAIPDIAVSVLATVIAHAPSLDRFTIDAGALAMSKDRSTQGRPFDAGFGLICDLAGHPLEDLHLSTVSQELGLVTSKGGRSIDFARFPVGSRVRVLPNHADMTAAAYEQYHLVEGTRVSGIWPRCNRW